MTLSQLKAPNFRRVGRALFGGTALAALASAALYIGASVLLEPLIYSAPPMIIWAPEMILGFILMMALTGFVLFFPFAATAGMFWHKRLMARGTTSAIRYWLPAGAAGLALGALLASLRWDPQLAAVSALMIGWGVLLGGFTGLFFWAIRRPDRDAPANPPTSAP